MLKSNSMMTGFEGFIENVTDVGTKKPEKNYVPPCRNKVCNSVWANLIQNLLFVKSLPTRDKNK